MLRILFRKIVKAFWLLPAVLLWASFPPVGESTDILFSLAPLVWLLRNADTRTNLKRWTVNGFLFWVATLSWMPAIEKNGGPLPLVILGWSALAAYCTLYFAAFGYLGSKYWQWARERGGYWRRMLGIMLVEPVLWAGLEIVRSRFAGGFAWNQLGVAAVNGGLGSPAVLGGVYLLSACIILVNGTIASIAERMMAPYFASHPRKLEIDGHVYEKSPEPDPFEVPRWVRSIETLAPFMVIFALLGVSGRCIQRPDASGAEPVRVAMIQRNFPCCFQAAEEDPYAVYSNLLEHVTMLRPELVVLSESALSEFGAIGGSRANRFMRWMADLSNASVLTGGGRYADGKEFNSALLRDRGGEQVYDKVHLVPFGEFIPGDKTFTVLQKLAPVGSCTPGELKLLELRRSCGNVPIGVAICFEDTDSAQIRELARMGAKVLVFITNDSWFAHSAEAVQHAWQARARAIETGLPVVRVGNSGVTGTVLPNGSASWLISENGAPVVDESGSMFDRIVPGEGGTPYAFWGDIPVFVAFLLLLAAFACFRWSHIYRGERQN